MTLLERAMSIIAPHNCLMCGNEGNLICGWCREEACPILPDRCYNCLAASDDSRVCAKCRPDSRLRHVWVRTDYDGPAKQLISRLKFERAQAAAVVIADYIQEALPYLPPSTIITHLPTATTRVRLRGYDHAELIAHELAKLAGLKHLTLLARRGQTRQVGAKRAIRTQQLAQAFRPLRPYMVQDAHVMVVDDVLTTGASLQAAARVLKQHGAKTVDAAVFAQKLKN